MSHNNTQLPADIIGNKFNADGSQKGGPKMVDAEAVRRWWDDVVRHQEKFPIMNALTGGSFDSLPDEFKWQVLHAAESLMELTEKT